MDGRAIFEGQAGFVMLLLAVVGATAVVAFVGLFLAECCKWVWRRLVSKRRRGVPNMPGDPPPMPPVKEPRLMSREEIEIAIERLDDCIVVCKERLRSGPAPAMDGAIAEYGIGKCALYVQLVDLLLEEAKGRGKE